ncbi:MAG: hypothetical protein JWN98_983 [Abditibacteriota bacterium]|nr:hypothetical protein [Abditibacteriota bacterium]
MADLAGEAGLQPDEPLLVNASRMCFYLWETAWQHAPGTVEGDADSLHDMRVAIRRLRSALQNFEGMPEVVLVSSTMRNEMKAQRRRAGKLGDALGAVRDFDVLDEYLRDYAKEYVQEHLQTEGSLSPGLAHFERFLQCERANAFAPMVGSINRAQEPGRLRENFGRWALGLPAALGPQLSLREAAHQILPLRIEEVLSNAPLLQDTANEEGQHEVRRALRRLRYTLEIFGPCFSEPIKAHVKVLVQMQDVLGEMQDRSVLRETAHRAFDEAIEEKKDDKKRQKKDAHRDHKKEDKKLHGKAEHTAEGGQNGVASEPQWPDDVNAFIDYGTRRRRQLLDEVRTLWQKQVAAGFWEKLRKLG